MLVKNVEVVGRDWKSDLALELLKEKSIEM
jgi:hypothetical protein